MHSHPPVRAVGQEPGAYPASAASGQLLLRAISRPTVPPAGSAQRDGQQGPDNQGDALSPCSPRRQNRSRPFSPRCACRGEGQVRLARLTGLVIHRHQIFRRPCRPTRTRSCQRAGAARVLLPEHQPLSILRQVAAEYQNGKAEQPACQPVDDLEQHPASQPATPRRQRPNRNF
jgi:hypothetical protein